MLRAVNEEAVMKEEAVLAFIIGMVCGLALAFLVAVRMRAPLPETARLTCRDGQIYVVLRDGETSAH